MANIFIKPHVTNVQQQTCRVERREGVKIADLANSIKTHQKGEARQVASRAAIYRCIKKEWNESICSNVSKSEPETKLEIVKEPGGDGLSHQCSKACRHQSLR